MNKKCVFKFHIKHWGNWKGLTIQDSDQKNELKKRMVLLTEIWYDASLKIDFQNCAKQLKCVVAEGRTTYFMFTSQILQHARFQDCIWIKRMRLFWKQNLIWLDCFAR